MSCKVVALCGGIGGAKLALGLAADMPPGDLTIIVNTGDDFSHFGLHISPDIDTVIYTLAGSSNRELGWGLANESWAFMDQMRALGGEDWFNLGDRDLALHVMRTHRLTAGESLSAITTDVARRLGVGPAILPMSDDPVRTMIDTDEGLLDFQHYFVARRAEPQVSKVHYEGAETATPAATARAALADPALEAVIICPSNPWLSIAPMLGMPWLADALRACAAPVIAVSPIVGGHAIKGPTAKLMAELGLPVSATEVARFYGDLIDGFVLDTLDAGLADEVSALGMATAICQTVMTDAGSKRQLAADVGSFARRLTGCAR
jgi:LPPG:FO 2-phospho-L-lactate transferase